MIKTTVFTLHHGGMKKALNIISSGVPVAVCATYCSELPSRCMSTNSPVVHGAEQNMKLEQVQVIFRHGARTPNSWSKDRFNDFSNLKPHIWDKHTMGNDIPGVDVNYTIQLPNGNTPSSPMYDENHGVEVEGGCMTGQLTIVGKRQLYDLGKWLAEKYILEERLISPSYKKDELYVRTTYFQRTTQSVVNLLAGLYDNTTITDTICIETKEDTKEDMYPNLNGCTKFINWTKHFFSPELRSSEVDDFQNYINDLMGVGEGKEKVWMSRLGDLIRCRRAHKFSIPQYLLDNEPKINEIELDTNIKWFGKGNVSIMSNCIGSFVDTLCARICERIDGSCSHKMFLYSGHDWTILPLLMAFGVDIDAWPPFATHLIMELYKRDDEKSFVRILYNGEPLILDNNSGPEFIPVERFLSLMEVYRVVDFD